MAAGASSRADAIEENGGKLYEMVVSALRSEILRGSYVAGSSLPSEAKLVSRFRVSRHTVREALRHLRDLGLIESQQGKRSVVVNPGGPQVYVHQVNSISDLHDFNVESRYDDHAVQITLDEQLAKRLDANPGETWLKIGGTRHNSSGKLICLVEIYVPQKFAGISRLLGRRSGPIYSLIEDLYGESIGEVEQELRAVPLPAGLSHEFDTPPSETVVEIRRIYRLLDGTQAEVTFNYYDAESFSFSMKLKRIRNSA